jgi:16S rRNA C967 or C1407 C5-methylase (RsmB/RsmF family)
MKQESITIFALDRDARRFKSLQKRMQELAPYPTGSTGVEVTPIHKDFLDTKPSDYPNASNIFSIIALLVRSFDSI